jgi:LPS export ABC transporter protein LptC
MLVQLRWFARLRSSWLIARSAFAAALFASVALPTLPAWAAPTTAVAQPPMRIAQMTFVATDGAVREILVSATQATVRLDADRADLEQVHAQWAGDDGELSLELRCEQGQFDLTTNDLVAVGDVRGRFSDGREFRGPWLRYDRARGIAFTDAPVTIFDQGRTLHGGGLRYHVRDRRLRLTAGASVVESP